MNEGEWNQEAYSEYNGRLRWWWFLVTEVIQLLNFLAEIFSIHALVTKLKSTRLSSKVHLLLTGLYSSCMNLESLDKSQGDSELKKAIMYLCELLILVTSSCETTYGLAFMISSDDKPKTVIA